MPILNKLILLNLEVEGIGGGKIIMITVHMRGDAGLPTAVVIQMIFTYFLVTIIIIGHSYQGLTMKDMVLLVEIILRLKLNSN